jgi:hypothetical protein
MPNCENLNKAKSFSSITEIFSQKNESPISGLLFGDKIVLDCFPYTHERGRISSDMFYAIKKVLSGLTDISFFQTHSAYPAQTHGLYVKDGDTWYLNTQSLDIGNDYIIEPNDIIENFKKAYISPNDRLFVNNKEILPDEYPKLFSLA